MPNPWKTFSRHIAIAFCGALAFTATAAPVCPARPIRVGFFEIGFVYKNGKGMDKDVIDELQKRSKCKFETAVYPRPRIFVMMEQGKLDIATYATTTAEREKAFWLAKYGTTKYYALISKKVPATIKSMEDFLADPSRMHWCTSRGLVWGPYFQPIYDELERQGRLEFSETGDGPYDMLALGRCEGLLAPVLVNSERVKVLKLGGKFTSISWDPNPRPTNLALSRITFTQAQAQEWQALVEQMGKDGTMRRILGQYLSGEELTSALP